MKKSFWMIMLTTIFLLLRDQGTAWGNDVIPASRELYEKNGSVLWEVHTDQKVIALTFDDGPDPVETEQILNLLKQYHAKSTFFAIGERLHAYPEVARKVVEEGHELANHTYHHVYFKRPVNGNLVVKELERTEEEILNITGKRSGLFRPPGGFYDDDLVKISTGQGEKLVLWSWHQDTRDWSRPGVYKIANKVIRNARNGDIVLFHDHVYGQSQTVQALKIILPKLQQEGFRFVTVSELMKSSKHRNEIKGESSETPFDNIIFPKLTPGS
ncbi:polysaccharide deacetylase family protein [Paenibacillus sp. HN-1]|uniref:polysaccharide deacetylase family protein n=1 Tax=Paenibacillus TaxID=44249 RepID=UPI001CA9C523|nr:MULTISPECIES: polysaccharide deacetylase family protein [Paenibacillus]MBY9078171.1 polysaccharide deacetylase family protein [Paenibacillus sp. CGMCC 1.18879]MBY9086502.1 polysaccharide deacetylase family protein [Paenibacillus sinensis]